MKKIKGIVYIIVAATSYGVMTTIVKKAYEHGFIEYRLLVGQLILSSLLLWSITVYQKYIKNEIKGEEIHQLAATEVCFTNAIYEHVNQKPKKNIWQINFNIVSKLVLLGIIGQGLTAIFYFKALILLPASIAIFLLFQFALISVIFDVIHNRKLPGMLTLIALAIIIVGTFLGVNLWDIYNTSISIGGILYGLASAFTFAIFLYFTGSVAPEIDYWMKSSIMISSAAVIVYIIYYPYIVLDQLFTLDILVWIIPLAMFGQIIPILLFNRGLSIVGGRLGAMLSTIELPATILLAFLFLGEKVHIVQWLGMIAIIAGIYVANKGENSA